MKVACTVWRRGKGGDNIKVLPIPIIISDPEWPNKVINNREEEVRICIECNNGCYENIREGKAVRCVISYRRM